MKDVILGTLAGVLILLIAAFVLLALQFGEIRREKDTLTLENDRLSVVLVVEVTKGEEIQQALADALTRNSQLIQDSAKIAALDPTDLLLSTTPLEALLDLIPTGNPFESSWYVTSRFDSDAGFGGDPRRGHKGLDIVSNGDWYIKPITSGRVVDIGIGQYEGKWIIIEHNQYVRTKVMHLSKIFYTALPGEEVTAKTNIGIMGETGNADGAHLHIEIHVYDGKQWIEIDPYPFIQGEN